MSTYDKESIYDIMRLYTDSVVEKFDSRYNVAPGANLTGLYSQDSSHVAVMRWGLVPLWAKPGTFKQPLINARAETIFEKPSFRSLIKKHRCLLPVNGFYEWNRQGDNKTPYYFYSTDAVLLLAALYQYNKQGVAECCIITTQANVVMEPVHHRMPVIVSDDMVGDWLHSDDMAQLDTIMQPAAEKTLQCHQVSSYVSNAVHDGERCVRAVT